MKKTLILFTLFAALLSLTAVAQPPADSGPQGGPHGQGNPEAWQQRSAARFEMLAKRLDLSEEQTTQWQEIVARHRQAHRGDAEEFHALQEELRTQMGSETPDTARIGELTLALREHREKAQANRTELNAELRTILTPEQVEIFDQMQARRGPRGERDGRHQGHRPGRRPGGSGGF